MNIVNFFKHAVIGSSLILTASVALAENEAVTELNQLVRGELSAVETYNQALGKYKDSGSGVVLQLIRDDHETAVKMLSDEAVKHGGVPDTKSGPWGVWAEAVTGGAKIVGESAALAILKQGEEHGLSQYKEILDEKDVPESCKVPVREQLIPSQLAHIKKLEERIAEIK